MSIWKNLVEVMVCGLFQTVEANGMRIYWRGFLKINWLSTYDRASNQSPIIFIIMLHGIFINTPGISVLLIKKSYLNGRIPKLLDT